MTYQQNTNNQDENLQVNNNYSFWDIESAKRQVTDEKTAINRLNKITALLVSILIIPLLYECYQHVTTSIIETSCTKEVTKDTKGTTSNEIVNQEMGLTENILV